MSLHIYIAHSGEHLLADPVAFASYVFGPFPGFSMRGNAHSDVLSFMHPQADSTSFTGLMH